MLQITSKKKERLLFYIVFIIFIITELLDDFLDHILGSSKIHSIVQLLLFVTLFFLTSKLFMGFYKSRVIKLIPSKLMIILQIIKESEVKGILVNQSKIRTKLNITKPTMKKRVDTLIELKYIFLEKEGTAKYLRITPLGDSVIK